MHNFDPKSIPVQLLNKTQPPAANPGHSANLSSQNVSEVSQKPIHSTPQNPGAAYQAFQIIC